jgi:hypothetical protein
MAELLPATQELLTEILDGLDPADTNLPELRVASPGRTGSRYWLYGSTKRSFPTRRPFAQFDELRAAGLLRKLRTTQSGTFYAFTPPAFRLRDELAAPPAVAQAARRRPSAPPPELTTATSRITALRELAARAEASLAALAQASSITQFRNDPSSDVFYVPINPWTWDRLDSSAASGIGAARTATESWLDNARLVVGIGAPEHIEEFEEHAQVLQRVYIRSKNADGPPAGTIEGVVGAIATAISRQLALIEDLPGALELPTTMVVPDTNALLHNPALEEWALGEEPVCIVTVQQVTSELDLKKGSHNEKVAAKAESLIRRFKEYSRRGDTFAGVKLAAGKTFREVPLTPDMTRMPASLDPDHADDRILAAALHLAATHLSSRVVLITRDRNLQNKARFARLPAVDIADL